MRVLLVAAEAAPWVKVGGLADVVASLSRSLAGLGVQVDLLLPGYRQVMEKATDLEALDPLLIEYGGQPVEVSLLRQEVDSNLTLTVIDEPSAFGRDGVYDDPVTKEGYRDNADRFAFFSRVAAQMAIREAPDLVHVHDSHASLVPGLLREVLEPHLSKRVPTVLTIHNLAYQMPCSPEVLFQAGFPESLFRPGSSLEFFGNGNFLKAGICYADAITTVSPRYSLEIQTEEMGAGLEDVLRSRREHLVGILNGIDVEVWNPETDPLIPEHYSVSDLAGKTACRQALIQSAGFEDSAMPVIGMVGRLADQKGIDIFAAAAPALAEMDVRFVILGSGQEKYHQLLNELQQWKPDRFSTYLGFSEELAHRIEAGSDFFLMPSRFEPCGLSQMYSMRYGTVPIVRRTGGLADTVIDNEEHPGEGNGLVFDAPSPEALLGKMRSAVSLYGDRSEHEAVLKRGMNTDFSSKNCAEKYLLLYQRVLDLG